MQKKRYAGIVQFMVLGCLVYAGSAQCGEIRPYELPSKNQQRTVVQEPQASQESSKVVDDSAYTNFQHKVSGMTPEQKIELRIHFSHKRDQAQELQEYKYYSRLVEILEKK